MNDDQTWKDTFSRLEEINANTIVITLGSYGSIYKKGENIYHIPPFTTEAVDTTGAGDIFHGAFAYCLDNNYSLEDTILISSLTSSISVESLGGQLSIPTLENVRNRKRERGIEINI